MRHAHAHSCACTDTNYDTNPTTQHPGTNGGTEHAFFEHLGAPKAVLVIAGRVRKLVERNGVLTFGLWIDASMRVHGRR
eukprot:3834948-Prymnesium_polylepis.1